MGGDYSVSLRLQLNILCLINVVNNDSVITDGKFVMAIGTTLSHSLHRKG
jgi:hypothetical protein